MELWKEARNGDKNSENQLFSNLYARYLKIAKHIIWNEYKIDDEVEKDREEIVSETIIALLDKLRDSNFILDKGLLQYSNVIFRNKVFIYFKNKEKDKLKETIQYDCESDIEIPDFDSKGENPETDDLLQYIKVVITKLSNDCQKIFLAFLNGYKIKEINMKFFPGTPRATIDNMVWRCRKSLKSELKKEGCLDGMY